MDYYIFRNCLMEDKLYIMARILRIGLSFGDRSF